MEVTSYFERNVLDNPDRVGKTKRCAWRWWASEHFVKQPDGRLRFWGRPEGREKYLPVIVTVDGTALHNAFFDSNFTRKQRRQR